MTADADDPVLEARIQHALAPYQDRLTPAALAEARRLLTVMLTTHPAMVPLMDRVRQGASPKKSGVATKGGAEKGEAPVVPPKRAKRGKGRP
jgi:hypothetical protein